MSVLVFHHYLVIHLIMCRNMECQRAQGSQADSQGRETGSPLVKSQQVSSLPLPCAPVRGKVTTV